MSKKISWKDLLNSLAETKKEDPSTDPLNNMLSFKSINGNIITNTNSVWATGYQTLNNLSTNASWTTVNTATADIDLSDYITKKMVNQSDADS